MSVTLVGILAVLAYTVVLFLLGKRLRWWQHLLLMMAAIAVPIVYAVAIYHTKRTVLASFTTYLDDYTSVTARQPSEPYIRGKVITVDVRGNEPDLLYFDLPEDLRAPRPEEVGTVIWLDCTRSVTSWTRIGPNVYEGGVSCFCDVTIVDYSIPAIIWQQQFEEDSQAGGSYQDLLYPDIVAFITALPRR